MAALYAPSPSLSLMFQKATGLYPFEIQYSKALIVCLPNCKQQHTLTTFSALQSMHDIALSLVL